MSKRAEILLLLCSDFIFVNLAWMAYFYIRIESGWIVYAKQPTFIIPTLVVFVYWVFVFLIAGQYRHWYIRSRYEEIVSVIKTVSFGCILIFLIIFIDDSLREVKVVSRFLILLYWAFLVIFVSLGRIFIRGFQKRALKKGIGLRNTLIIGTGQRALELFETTKKYPEHGYKVIGFIGDSIDESNKLLGSLSDLPQIIKEYNISEVLIASDTEQRNIVIETLNICADLDISIKIRPELYEIISGMAKTHQLYGIPLIDVMPELMNFRSRILKRIIDLTLSILILLISLPVLIITALLIVLTSKGPVFYLQERVGRYGKHFMLIKFRSMIVNAEDDGKAVWADKYDQRVTTIGRIMRRIRLDELPQLINVIKNEMSIVGPRPERPYFVEILKEEVKYYPRRLRIKPGITGWAQVNHPADNSIDDVRIKLQYDFYYIENMSLNLDFQILINTIVVIFTMRGW